MIFLTLSLATLLALNLEISKILEAVKIKVFYAVIQKATKTFIPLPDFVSKLKVSTLVASLQRRDVSVLLLCLST